MGNVTFPCRCFAFPSSHYELLVGDTKKLEFSVISEKEFLQIPENISACQPLEILFDEDAFCYGLDLTLQVLYSPANEIATSDDELHFTKEFQVPLAKPVKIPCQYLCLPGVYRFAVVTDGLLVKVRLFFAI
ncbi:unnamed protein product [Gongylonema pulchrum]|uniref:Hydrocephalus-inducing protein homolog n=1 Tax=Gongylonema pulchrum TaxID=637853 RepID=A0A183E1A3_9BILA|nr:unnamed protein product [Gongylonema pulchrum]